MEEKELELFRKAWQFLVRETAAARGFQVKSAVISEVQKTKIRGAARAGIRPLSKKSPEKFV